LTSFDKLATVTILNTVRNDRYKQKMVTTEQELFAALRELEGLRNKLAEKEQRITDLGNDVRLYRAKCKQLEAVLPISDTSEHASELKIKILQNAGLTAQLQGMRRELDEAIYTQTTLKRELWTAQDTIKRLGEERRAHQRMVIEMSDVLRMLGAIQIEYEKADEPCSWSAPDRSLDNIKMKVHAIEEDRQRLISENQELQTQLFEKDIDLDDFKDQVMLLEEAGRERDDLLVENKNLKELCENQFAKIKSMEKSSGTESKVPVKDIMYEGGTGIADVEAVLQDDGSTVVVPSTTSVSGLTADHDRHLVVAKKRDMANDEVDSLFSLEPPVVETDNRDEEIEKLRNTLKTTEKKYKTAQKKQQLHEKMIHDVIFHYKKLQKEHDAASALLSEKGLLPEKKVGFKSTSTSKQNKVASDEISESPTAETTESSDDNNSNPECKMAEAEYLTEEDYRRLENECTRLEHQYEDAVVRITALEEDMAATKMELEQTKAAHSDKQKEISDLQLKLDIMEADFNTATEKSLQLQENLQHMEQQAAEAKKKRDERELDLWDVIDQYKKLNGENESNLQKIQNVETQLGETEAVKKSVERQLGVTKRQIKRNDLVYENIRMEQKIQTYEQQIESLERYLKQARSEAIHSKEDAKCIRKLLSGCNFNFQQLQERYEELVRQQTTAEMEKARAERSAKLQEKMDLFRRTQKLGKSNRSTTRPQPQESVTTPPSVEVGAM